MKKRVLPIFLLLSCLIAMTSCASNHEHSYTEKQIPATCAVEGYNLFECECGDSYKGETRYPKTEHTGSISCDSCGLNYYDELKDIIITNGRAGGSAGVTVYDGKITSDGSATMSTYVVYDKGEEEIQIMSIYDLSIVSYTFIIVIPHPSNGDAIKNSKYTWICGMSDCSALGILNANTFSSYTESLVETVNDGFNTITISSARSTFAFLAKYGIKDAFIPLLDLGNKGLNIKNFGFINY